MKNNDGITIYDHNGEPIDSRSLGPNAFDNPNNALGDIDLDMDYTGRRHRYISQETAFNVSTLWKAVSIIAYGIAKIPVNKYDREDADNGIHRDGVNSLISRSPRRDRSMTAFQFWAGRMVPALTQGNGYAFISRDKLGRPVELVPVETGTMWPVTTGGRKYYHWENPQSRKSREIEPMNVVHVKGLGDGDEGMSVIKHARTTLTNTMNMEEYGARFFETDPTPRVAVLLPTRFKDDTSRQEWMRHYKKSVAGMNKMNEPLLIEGSQGSGAAEIKSFSINHDDMQFLESRKFSIIEIANWFNLLPGKLGDDAKSSFASVEAENQAHLDDTLDPWLVNIEQELNLKLLTDDEFQQDTHYIEFNREAFVRVNYNDKINGLNKAVGAPFMTDVEARKVLNLPRNPDGDILKPLNMSTSAKPDDESLRYDMLKEAVDRCRTRYRNQFKTKSKQEGWREKIQVDFAEILDKPMRLCGLAYTLRAAEAICELANNHETIEIMEIMKTEPSNV